MTNRYDIIWLDTVDSTNEAARRQISDIDNLSVLSALEQTSGKGQKGNRWSSARGENLTFSIVLKFSGPSASCRLPSLLARNQFLLTEIASLSVMDLLSRHGISAEIKWPNDIYVDNKKICGMLIENSLRGQYLSSSIIGIGLNVKQRNFDVNLPNPTSMLLCMNKHDSNSSSCSQDDGTLDLKECLKEFMDIFTSYHDKYLPVTGTESEGLNIPLSKLYLEHLWRIDRPSNFIDYTILPSGHHDGPMPLCTTRDKDNDGREFPGIIRGLSDIGNLIVENLTTCELREFAFKEIGYIL